MIDQSRQKRTFIIICVCSIVIITIISMAPLFMRSNDSKPETGSGATTMDTADNKQSSQSSEIVYNDISNNQSNLINNYDAIVHNLPITTRNETNRMLLYTLYANNIHTKPSDITIRKGSYSQSIIDTNLMIYRTTYIVDIPSIKQSYQVSNLYSPIPKNNPTSYTTTVTCLDSANLIYGPFNCTDQIKQERGE